MGKKTQAPKVKAQGFKAEAEQRAEIARIHSTNTAAEPPARSPLIRWIVPRAYGRPLAHAHLEGAARTMCLGVPAGGGVYPPAPDVPLCPECSAKVAERARRAWAAKKEREETVPVSARAISMAPIAPLVAPREEGPEETVEETCVELEELANEIGELEELASKEDPDANGER